MQVIYPVPFPLAVNVFPFISPSEGSDIVYVTPCVIEEEYPSESIPLNVLMPIHGTAYENLPGLSEDEIRRTVAMFRFLNPEAFIRLAAGRILMENSGWKAFRSGANAAITGDMLTTSGNSIAEDREMLLKMGFILDDV